MIALPESPRDSPSLILRGIEALARGDRPELPATDDGNRWEDGLCWLYCAEWTRVMWIGPVTVAGATAPMAACESCIRRLSEFVWGYLYQTDVGADRTQPPAQAESGVMASETGPSAPRSRARHRRPVIGSWRSRAPHRDGG
ncbi:hypothetical protein ACFVHB_12410 [Kitasatospora sp. NPDC127111]|uniref:hypothetical protein n=1 Tax=Kitasatospora sp. NPDC127111 TaxID=3345363 RepID=UPI003628FC84